MKKWQTKNEKIQAGYANYRATLMLIGMGLGLGMFGACIWVLDFVLGLVVKCAGRCCGLDCSALQQGEDTYERQAQMVRLNSNGRSRDHQSPPTAKRSWMTSGRMTREQRRLRREEEERRRKIKKGLSGVMTETPLYVNSTADWDVDEAP